MRGHFQALFRKLFGGGQADIVLEEGADILDSGIEIVARPPGKEPRSISLLSGGEKTLTCVALLLAIFRSRPSPFCVLDEVDAALDEANIERFIGVLQEFLGLDPVHHRHAFQEDDDLRQHALRRDDAGVGRLEAGLASASRTSATTARFSTSATATSPPRKTKPKRRSEGAAPRPVASWSRSWKRVSRLNGACHCWLAQQCRSATLQGKLAATPGAAAAQTNGVGVKPTITNASVSHPRMIRPVPSGISSFAVGGWLGPMNINKSSISDHS